jgi:hypothetical protein
LHCGFARQHGSLVWPGEVQKAAVWLAFRSEILSIDPK